MKIDYQTTGPGGAVLKSKLLETNEPVLINYCDFSNIWDWENLKFAKKIIRMGLFQLMLGYIHTAYMVTTMRFLN